MQLHAGLYFRTAFLGLFFWFAYGLEFNLLITSVFIASALFAYFSVPTRITGTLFAYVMFLVSAVTATLLLQELRLGEFLLLYLLIFTAAILLFYGVHDYVFKDRTSPYLLFHSILLFFAVNSVVFLRFYSLYAGLVLMFVLIFLLIQDILIFNGCGKLRSLYMSAVVTLLGMQIYYFAGYLSLGSVQATLITASFVVLSRDLLLTHIRGNLSLSFVFRQGTYFSLFLVMIFSLALF